MKSKKQKSSGQKSDYISKLGLTIGLGVATAVAAGSYYLYGTKDGVNKRRKIRGWTLKFKGEVLDKLERLNDIDKEKYEAIVDRVAEKYGKMSSVEVDDLHALVNDLKRHWKNIQSDVNRIKSEIDKAKNKNSKVAGKSSSRVK